MIPTIEDLLKKAKYPGNLRIGICHQYHPEDKFDNLDKYKKDNRFRIVDVLYSTSKGVCAARNLTQKLYMGEQYTLQIDSHTRFAKDWDVKLIDMLQSLQKQGYAKPLLTGYVYGYNPKTKFTAKEDLPPLQLAPDKFMEGILVFKSAVIPYWNQLVCPVPAKFFSGHFYFTIGNFCKEVPYDPEIYFLGEEISMAVRAFTHGYDLFHPHKNLIWHEYSRRGRVKQWDDDKSWYLKNLKAYSKLRKLLGIEDKNKRHEFVQFGLGNERSLSCYEKYAGVFFNKLKYLK